MVIKRTNNNFQALTSREDAYFISRQNWFVVADGVGQWSLEGIVSIIFVFWRCVCLIKEVHFDT